MKSSVIRLNLVIKMMKELSEIRRYQSRIVKNMHDSMDSFPARVSDMEHIPFDSSLAFIS